MVTQGAWFQQAAYPYLTTVTCAGHATISTGVVPARPRRLPERVVGSRGAQADDVHRGSERDRTSATACRSPAATARTACRCRPSPIRCARSRRRTSSRCRSKARSAIMLGGHGGDAVTWLTETLDGWETLAGYSETGVPAVEGVHRREPDRRRLRQDVGRAACRPPRTRAPTTASAKRRRRAGRAASRIVLKGTADADGRHATSAQWERSPFADAYLGRFADGARRVAAARASTTAPTCSRSASRAPTSSATRSARAATRCRTSTRTWTRRIGALFDQLDAHGRQGSVGRGAERRSRRARRFPSSSSPRARTPDASTAARSSTRSSRC